MYSAAHTFLLRACHTSHWCVSSQTQLITSSKMCGCLSKALKASILSLELLFLNVLLSELFQDNNGSPRVRVSDHHLVSSYLTRLVWKEPVCRVGDELSVGEFFFWHKLCHWGTKEFPKIITLPLFHYLVGDQISSREVDWFEVILVSSKHKPHVLVFWRRIFCFEPSTRIFQCVLLGTPLFFQISKIKIRLFCLHVNQGPCVRMLFPFFSSYLYLFRSQL